MPEQEIYELAKRNTPLLLTAEIQDMDYVLKRIAEKEMGDSYREALIDSMLQHRWKTWGDYCHEEDGEVFKDPKSESSIRKIPLPVSVMEELKIGYIHYKEKRLAYGKGFVDSGFIFCKENGEPYKLSTIAQRYNRFLKRNGFRHIKFHNVRVSHSLLYSVL